MPDGLSDQRAGGRGAVVLLEAMLSRFVQAREGIGWGIGRVEAVVDLLGGFWGDDGGE